MMTGSRILVVEDEKIVAEDIRLTLSDLGYEVAAVVATGEEAIEKCAELEPDLVLMDIVLEGEIDGIETAKRMRSVCDVPIIYLSAYANYMTGDRMPVTEPYSYLLKPFKPVDLGSAIKIALHKHSAEQKIKESEVRYRALFENMGNAVAVYKAEQDGEDFVLIDFNKAAEKIEQTSRSEVLGKSVLEVFPGVKEFGLFDVIQRVCRTGQSEYHPVSEYKDNRITGWRENFVYKLPSREVVTVYSDETEHMQSEEALRQSEEKYRLLHEAMRDAFVIVDMTGRIQETNQAYRAMLGYSEDELRNLTYMDLTPQQWHAIESSIVEGQVLVKGCSDVYCKEFRRKDGTIFPVELRTFLVKDAAGQASAMWAIVRDITQRKRFEERLVEYERVVEGLEEMIVVVDRDYRYVLANRAFLNYRGLEREQLIGRLMPELLDKEVFDKVAKEKVDACLQGEVVEYEMRYKYETLGERDLLLRYLPIEGPAGVDRAACVLLDITNRKRVEHALQESEERYRVLFNDSRDAVYVTSRDGELIEANQAYFDLLGYKREEIIGGDVRVTYVNRSDRDRFVLAIESGGFLKDYPLNVSEKGWKRN